MTRIQIAKLLIAPLLKPRPRFGAGGSQELDRVLFSHETESLKVALTESQISSQSAFV